MHNEVFQLLAKIIFSLTNDCKLDIKIVSLHTQHAVLDLMSFK